MDFHGGPRDGDRIVVEGKPATFDVPIEITRRKGTRGPQIMARYGLRSDGGYEYIGQVPEGAP